MAYIDTYPPLTAANIAGIVICCDKIQKLLPWSDF